MCGIYLSNIPSVNSDLKTRLERIKFRGPDNIGVRKINQLMFGHLRLSIIDLDSRSNQPMSLDDTHITYNGEIYNYEVLRSELIELGHTFRTTSDTEVLLVGYKEWGKGLLSKINGMFAFCIYNSKSQEVICARDRLGVKPLYYYWEDGKFEICSQLKPMESGKTLDGEAISSYLDCGYIPSPFSIYKEIRKLPPGNYLILNLDDNTVVKQQYWNLKKVKKKKISYSQAKKEVHDLLTDAVKIRLRSDVPIGTFLSGGIDSALVSSIASKIMNKPLNTFSIGFENPDYDESPIATAYANHIKSNHTSVTCKSSDVLKLIPKLIEVYDEPFADSSALPSLLVNSKAKGKVTVALSGDGGDESFLGYNYFTWLSNYLIIFTMPWIVRKHITRTKVLELFGKNNFGSRDAINTKSKESLVIKIFAGFNSIQKKRIFSWMRYYDDFKNLSNNIFQKAADLNIKLWLENDSNVKVDRASMAYSMEIRSPFLDYRIIEMARNLPVKYRFSNGVKKKILKDILSEYIPKELYNQPKRGFAVPLGEWIRKELKSDILEILDDNFLNKVPNLDINKFKHQLLLHMDKKEDNSFNIWKLYILGKWYKEFGFS